jgi:hypothetical protein
MTPCMTDEVEVIEDAVAVAEVAEEHPWHDAVSEPPNNHRDVLIVREWRVNALVGWYGVGQWYTWLPDGQFVTIDDVEFWSDFNTKLPNGRNVG